MIPSGMDSWFSTSVCFMVSTQLCCGFVWVIRWAMYTASWFFSDLLIRSSLEFLRVISEMELAWYGVMVRPNPQFVPYKRAAKAAEEWDPPWPIAMRGRSGLLNRNCRSGSTSVSSACSRYLRVSFSNSLISGFPPRAFGFCGMFLFTVMLIKN